MWKTILAGAAVIAIASTSFVYAQQRGNAAERGHAAARPVNRGLSQEDRAAFTDARIAALKAGLRLTPDQETNWPAFETALRDIAKAHAEHRAEPRQSEPRPNDPVAKLRRHAEMMTNAAASLTRLADAQEPLYQSLDDSQKRRFHLLSRILSGHQAHFAQERGPGWHQMHERHHGGDDRRSPGPRGMRGQDRGGSDSDGMAEQL
jgi:hypothetical protein